LAANVSIEWHWIELHPTDIWSVIAKKLVDAKVNLKLLPRCVYVIRAADSFAIRYPNNNYSPTLYIGEGRFKQRVTSHRKWLAEICELTGEFPLEVAICFPRVRNNDQAHKEFEAHLLGVFFKRFGSLPLKNKIHERKNFEHSYERVATTEVLGPGKGKRYKWALEPLKANPFYKAYVKTHKA
jgi:hypothetical protein